MNNYETFKNLKRLILIEMKLNWNILSKVINYFKSLEDLILCKNEMNDKINLNNETLQNLTFINLEENQISDFSQLSTLGKLPKLERMTLNKNFISNFGKFEGFSMIQTISIDDNLIENPKYLHELSQFKKLSNFRIKNNPCIDKYGSGYVRQRVVAEVKTLSIVNGGPLKRFERKDCELFYMRKTFEEFFTFSNSKYWDYDFQAFIEFCKENHPRIEELITIYGNLFELAPKKERQELSNKNILIKLTVIALSGPKLGKLIVKKFPENSVIRDLKNIIAKLVSITNENQILSYKPHPKEPMEVIDDDYKTLLYYNMQNGGEIYVDDNQNN